MALVIRELTTARLADVDDAIGDVSAWWDNDYRCDTTATFPPVDVVKGGLAANERAVVAFDNTANKVYGLALFRLSSPGVVRVRWLVARPAVFGAAASALCSAVQARLPGAQIWGCVIRDAQRERFTATGNFAVVNRVDVGANHPVRNYPDGTCIRYIGG